MATIGLAYPYYAIYHNNGALISYSGGGEAGAYTEINLTLEDASDNDFYANDTIKETDPGFAGGTVEITTDDLRPEIAEILLGLAATPITTPGIHTSGAKWLDFDDAQSIPYVGFGGRLMKKIDGAIKYVAFAFPKIRFRNPPMAVTTKGAQIEWQTQTLTADISRSDAAGHKWYCMSSLLDSEADAIAAVKDYLGLYQAPTLDSLAIGEVPLSPAFSPSVTSYTATALTATEEILATATNEGDSIAVTVNGIAIDNGGTASLNDGENIVAVTVTGAEGTSITYEVTVAYNAG